MQEEESDAIERGRSLESKSCNFESSQSASLVSCRSSISSLSASVFPDSIVVQNGAVTVAGADDEDEDESAILVNYVFLL